MATISLKGVGKVYPNHVVAVQAFDLDIQDQEFVVLVGPSGCGKSTTLRMIAGLEQITTGELLIAGKRVNDAPPKDRDIAMVFQNYALYPHMTVYENMAFPLKLRKLNRQAIDERVREIAELLEITDYLDRKPKALSGGQRQRVAIGRAIVRKPQVILMDEPLSNLDAKLRSQMRTGLLKLRQKIQTTFVYVTHDQTEAMTLGDRIVIMKDGLIQQIGTPSEVFDRPHNRFVAEFIGTPQMQILPAQLFTKSGQSFVRVLGIETPLEETMGQALHAKGIAEGSVLLGIRPEHFVLAHQGQADAITGTVEVREMMGSKLHLHVRVVHGQEVVLCVPRQAGDVQAMQVGDFIAFAMRTECIHLFDRETEQNLLDL